MRLQKYAVNFRYDKMRGPTHTSRDIVLCACVCVCRIVGYASFQMKGGGKLVPNLLPVSAVSDRKSVV